MIYFIRHAQSHFNFDADVQLRNSMGPNFSKHSPQYLELKFHPKYVDSGLTPQGNQQCLAARDRLKDIAIDLVLVSPMRRALQTCDIIFRDHPSKPRILVEPGVRQIFSSSCDIGSRLAESMGEIPYFDYSQIQNPDIWYLETIRDEEVRGHLMAQVGTLQQGEQRRKKAEDAMLEYLKGVYGKKNQFHLSDMEGQKAKLRKLSKEYERIAVVSHYENIFAVTQVEPRNGEVIEFSFKEE